MTTRIPTQQRTIRETRIEAVHAEADLSGVPAVHFKIAGHPQTEEASDPFQVAPPTELRIASHLPQIAKTTLPLLLSDCVGLAVGLGVASLVTALLFAAAPASLSLTAQLFSNGLAFLLIYSLLGLYPGVGLNPIIELRSLAWGTFTAGAMLLLVTGAFGHWDWPHITFVASLTLVSIFAVPLFRCSARSFLSKFSWWGQPAIIIGRPESSLKLMNLLKKKSFVGLHPVGFVHNQSRPGDSETDNSNCLGGLADLPELSKKHHVFWALIAPEEGRQTNLSKTLQYCNSIPNVVMIPGFDEFPSLWNRTQDLGGVMGICFRERLLDPWAQVGKRAFDVIAVLLGTLLLSPFLIPFLLVTWVCLKWISPGPLFYGQERVGKDGVRFQAWKFRTMVLNADTALKVYLQKHPEKKQEWDVNQKLRNDPRIIPGIGAILRKTSLDELPQLWNVLCGDMSLVGPRPFMTEQTAIYGERVALYHRVRPGITGMWQISGRNHTTFEERGKFDAYYVRNWSFWLDIFILGRTVKTVLFREGAF